MTKWNAAIHATGGLLIKFCIFIPFNKLIKMFKRSFTGCFSGTLL